MPARDSRGYHILNKRRLNTARDERVERRRVMNAGRARPDRCEICGREGKVTFDHDHAKYNGASHSAVKAFRGWICQRCNAVLGLVQDNTELLHKLIEYL